MLTETIWLPLAIVAVLMVLSFLFSLSETSLTTVSRGRIHQLAEEGDRRAALVERLTGARERLIGTILLGNNIVNIAASTLAAALLTRAFGDAGVVYATVAMTAFIVIFTEVLPKTLALVRPHPFAMAVAPLMRVLVFLLAPITAAIQALVNAIARLFGFDPAKPDDVSGHEELRGTLDLLHAEGEVVKSDHSMIDAMLDLRDLTVSDVMVHRTRMTTLDIDTPPAALVQAVLDCAYSRIPLYERDPEEIVGVLHVRDVLRAVSQSGGDAGTIDFRAMMSEPWFVPASMPLRTQLAAFLNRRRHMALVLDEYGVVEGLVTLEDIIEEIVGVISDEHDEPEDEPINHVRRQIDGSYVMDAGIPIRDINRALDWSLPDEDANTLAGIVLHAARVIPDVGQEFTAHGFRFKVLGRERQRITRVKVTPLERDKA
jgi:Mg2+/Co2+ transporter CorB